jgi:hypothetical protein
VTAAVTPGESELFKIALSLRNDLKPLKKTEIISLKSKAAAGEPLFKYQGKA